MSYANRGPPKRKVELITEPLQCMPCTEARLAREKDALINFHDEEITIKEGIQPIYARGL